MRILYPVNPLETSQADEPYQEEFLAAKHAGYVCSLFDFDALKFDEFKPIPNIQAEEKVLYRGWMLNSQGYSHLTQQIARKNAKPITSHSEYLRCHHLLGWYEQCADFTAETLFLKPDTDFEAVLAPLGWDGYFVKDFVKSNTGDRGSITYSPSEVNLILEQISMYRGEIEGGVAVRRFEKYKPQTERRYFVVHGVPYSYEEDIPELVHQISRLVHAPFYSVDVVETVTGELRLVELGDGQVSDKKAWPMSKFMEVIAALG